MCTTYGNTANPRCKAYQEATKILPLTAVAVTLVGGSGTDKVYIGDPTCGLDGYLKEITIAKDGNILDTTCTNCKLAMSVDISNHFCLSCASPKVEYNGACITSCGSGFLLDAASNQCYCPQNNYISGSACLACSSGCDSCSSSALSACSSCETATPTLYLSLSPTGSCVSTCPSGTYPESTGLYCAPCDVSCVDCTGRTNTQCVGCQSGYFRQPAPSTSSCLTTCPTKYYQDTILNTCQPCHLACNTCTGPTYTECLSCDTGYYLLGATTCVLPADCPTGTYPDSSTFTCTDCISPCSTCSSSTGCITCVNGYYLQPSPYNNQCLSTCPVGYYTNSITSTCSSCMSPCTNCVGPSLTDCIAGCPVGCASCPPSSTSCTSCLVGYYLINSKCVSQCPSSTYQESITRKCVSCPTNCVACDSSECSMCASSYYLYNNICYLSCPAFTYNSTALGSSSLTCGECDATCLTCAGPGPQNCSLCQGGLFLFNRQCLLECPGGTYETKLKAADGIDVPVCSPKIALQMSIGLTDDPRQVLIRFSSSVSPQYLNLFLTVLQVTLQNVDLDISLISTRIVNNATINLALLTSIYIADGTPLRADLLLGSDFDDDSTNMYTLPIKYASVKLAEYYPFTQSESTTIETASDLSKGANTANTAAQSAAMVAGGGFAGFLLQVRLITDLIQLLQFLDITWPPNVMDLFRQAYIDPSNLFVPVCLISDPESYLLPNVTVSRVLEIQQISTVYLTNNCYALSTFILVAVVIFSLKVWLQFKKPSIIPQKLANLGTALDKVIAWNVALQIFVSNYPLFFAYSILQIMYSNFETQYMNLSFSLAVISAISCTAFVAWTLILAWKYSKICVKAPAEADAKYQRYSSLFEGVKNNTRIQLFQIPLSILRIYLMVVFVLFLSGTPLVATILLCCTQAVFLFYLFKYRPHKDRLEFFVTILSEILVLCALLIALVIKVTVDAKMTVENRNRLGWGLISMNLAISMATALMIAKQLFLLGVELFKKIKARCQSKRNQISPLGLFESRSSYKKNPTESIISGKDDYVVTKNDLTCAIHQIDSVQHLLKSNLNISEKSLSEIKIRSSEKLKIESLLKNTLKLLDGSPTGQISPNSPLTLFSPNDLNRTSSSPLISSKRNSKRMTAKLGTSNKEIPHVKKKSLRKERDPHLNSGAIFLDHQALNTEKQNISSGSNPEDKETSLSLQKENSIDAANNFKRYFFQIPSAYNQTASININEGSSEYTQNDFLDNNQVTKSEENQSDEEKSAFGRASLESQRRSGTSFLLQKKKTMFSAFGGKVRNRLASLQFLGLTNANAKSSLE